MKEGNRRYCSEKTKGRLKDTRRIVGRNVQIGKGKVIIYKFKGVPSLNREETKNQT